MAFSLQSTTSSIFISTCFGSLVLLLSPVSVSGAALELSPMFQEIILDETQATVPVEVALTNTTVTPMTFEVTVYDFESLDDSGGIAFLGNTGMITGKPYQLAPWFTLEQNLITVSPQEERVVRGSIQNTPEVAPGGHYGAIVFRSLTNENNPSVNAIAINQVLASLILVKKQGGAVPSLELKSQDWSSSWFTIPKGNLLFRSSGNVHVIPRGLIRLVDPLGRNVAKGIINEASTIVLPGSERRIPIKLLSDRPFWVPGWYRLEITYRIDGQEEVMVVELRRFFVPWMSLGALVGGLLLLLLLRFRQRVRRLATSVFGNL